MKRKLRSQGLCLTCLRLGSGVCVVWVVGVVILMGVGPGAQSGDPGSQQYHITSEALRVDMRLNAGKSGGNPDPMEDFDGPVGLELYSLRNELNEDVPGTLKMVRDMGFEIVEVAGFLGGRSAQEMRAELDEAGLRAVSVLMSYEDLRDDPAAVLDDAEALGVAYVGTAWIDHAPPFDEAAARQAAAYFNEWGRLARERGMTFFYHVHGYEFHPYRDGTLFDLLMEETDPELVDYQMDVFWVTHPGQDPVALLQKYPDRWSLMHLKDMRTGTPTGDLSGHAPEDTNVPLGTGQIDYQRVLREAERIGVEYYFIEDEHENAAEQIPQSLRWLETVRF